MSLLLALQATLAGDYAGAFNVVPDPSFEAADLSQWTVVGGATLSQSTSNATSRSHSLRVQGTLAEQGARIAVPTIPGQLYTASVDVFVATGAGTVAATMLVQGSGNAAPPGGTGAFTLQGAFRATAASTLITLWNDGGAGAFDFYFDSLALIPAPAVPYFDGSSAGGEWLGTPDHSASRLDDVATRVARSLGRTGADALATNDNAAPAVALHRTAPDALATSDAAAPIRSAPRATTERLATRDDDRNLFVYQSFEGGLLPSPLGGGLALPSSGATLAVADSTDSTSGSKSLELTVTIPQPGNTEFTVDLNHFGPNNNSLTPGDTRNIPIVPNQVSSGLGMVKIVSATGGNVTSAGFGTTRYNAAGSSSGSSTSGFTPTVGVWASRSINSPTVNPGDAFLSPCIRIVFDSTTTQVVLRLDQLVWREDGGNGSVTYFDGDTQGAVWEGGTGLGPSRIGHAVRAVQSFPRSTPDALGTHDAAVPTRNLPRTAPDALATHDAAARSLALPRTAPDWLGTDDVYRNYVIDPSFEASAAGVRAGTGSGTTSATIVSDPLVGTSAAEITWNGSGSNNPSPTFELNIFGGSGANLDPTDSRNIRVRSSDAPSLTLVSFKIVSVTGGTVTSAVASRARFSAAGVVQGGSGGTGIASPVTGTWYQDSIQTTTQNPFASPELRLAVTSGVTQVVVHVDRVLFAIAPGASGLPPDYFDGGSGAGAAWEGTPNASTSTLTIGTRVVRNLGRTAPDSLGTTDAASRTPSIPRTAADSLGTADSAVGTSSGAPGRSTSDSLSTTDAATRPAQSLARAGADALATADLATRSAPRSRTSADALGTADAAARSAQAPARSAPDSLATSDASTRGAQPFVRTGSDALGTSDAATRSQAAQRSGSDGLGTSDAAARAIVHPRSAADALATSDAATRPAQLLARTGADSLGTADLATRSAQAPARASADALGTTDAAVRQLSRARSAADALGTSDLATRPAQLLARSGADALGTSDAATRSANRTRAGADALATADSATATRTLFHPRTGTDSLGTTDAASRAAQRFARTGSDALGTSDVATTKGGPRAATDALGTTDQATRLLSHPRAGADALGTTDLASRAAQAPARTAADLLATADAAARAATYHRAGADALATSDAASRSAARTRLGSDSLGTSDQATPGAASHARAAADQLATLDAATRAYRAIRLGSDATTLSDAAAAGAAVSGRLALDALLTDDAAYRATSWARLALDSLLTSDLVHSAPPPETYVSAGRASPLYSAGGSGAQADARGYVTPTIEP